MPGIRIGRFQVLGKLGAGAHSIILHVRRSADARSYALKVVPINGRADTKFQRQAFHEFRVAQMLDHPNLIKIYSLEVTRDWLFRTRSIQLLIEYVNGRTLDTFPALPVPQLVRIFARIAAGLAHMHRRKVYHADLKPNNILLSRTGEVKIIDFGLAWVGDEDKQRVQGTPEYMAPEQARRGFVDQRTDIYNFGATMYRLTTGGLPPDPVVAAGGLPLDARSWRQLIKPVREANPDAPPALADLIHACLAFNAHERPARMTEVQDVLDRLAGSTGQSADDRLEEIEF